MQREQHPCFRVPRRVGSCLAALLTAFNSFCEFHAASDHAVARRTGPTRPCAVLGQPSDLIALWGLILSEKEGTLSDIMPRPRTYNSTADRIRERVQKADPDTVFHAGQFLDLDTRTAVDKALSRLVASGFLRRLARGLYYQPKEHPVLGDILPPVEAVARALADRDHVRLQPFGGYAANLLRLSNQVPARVVLLTDGKPRKVRYGRQVIELRRASPRMMAAAGRMTGLVIAGLRYVGRANVTPERVAHLRKLLSREDRRRLIEDIPLALVWMHPYFRAIAQEEDPS